MNPTTTHSAVKRRTGPLLIGAALVGVLALAGCTPDAAGPTSSPSATTATPTPTPTPTDAGAPVPQSEEEAVEAAKATVTKFISLSNAVAVEKGQNPERLSAVAIDPSLREQLDSAKAIADNGYVITGESTLEVQTSYASDLTDAGTTVPFGSVTIQGCYDSSDRAVKTADGADAPQPASLRTIREINVIYSTADSAWFVRTFTKVDSTC
jgi:hypothetical protein